MRSLIVPALLSSLLAAGCPASKPPATPVEEEAPPLPGGIELVEEITRADGDIVIPYRKFRLPNGLTVILHEDDSDPLVHVDVTYHVGSAREDIGKSGFAHFFEHMMFQGSVNVADEEHFKIITEAGGTLNGTTNTDRTNYYETVPSNQLEKMLWLEADRMGFLLPAVTQEKFEVQRETVKNERGQRVDNAPYGLLGERMGEAMFPEGHPYSWSVIGYMADLDRADLDDLKRFFLRWYGPNNATLTVGGRFDEAQVLQWVAKYFGSIPAGPAVEPMPKEPVTLDADRYISMEDEVALPLVYMSWPTVHARHPDEAPLDVLMNILGVGRTSLLYKNLVKDGTAVQAQAGHGCRELHCEFTLLALPNPQSGKNLAEIEAVLRSSLEEFEERGVLDDDLERVKAGIVADMVYGLESVSSKVSTLAYNETFTGDPNYIGRDIERYSTVTKEDVVRVYEQYIKDKPAVIMSIVPKGQLDLIAHEDTWERYERAIPISNDGELQLREPTDDFDRSVRPDASGDVTLTMPTTWRAELDSGVEVLGAVNDETPTTAIRVRLRVGQLNESKEQLGLAALAAAMHDEATTETSNEEMSNRLDKLGSSVWVSSGDRYTTLTLKTLSANLDETLAIAAEKLLKPKMDPADFERVKAQTLQGIEVAKTQPSTTASAVYRRLVYGDDNTFAFPDSGITETVSAITLDDVKAFVASNYSVELVDVIVVSDVPKEQVLTGLQTHLAGMWSPEEVATPEVAPLPELSGGTLYLVDKPGAAQSEIRMGRSSLPRDFTGDFYRATLMNYALGGAFNSRINLNLREDKGYTYGARATFAGNDDVGRYTAAAGVRTDATAPFIVEFRTEIEQYKASGPTPEEVAFTKASIGQRDAREYETPSQKLGFLADILTYDLPDDFVEQQQRILEEITEEQLDALAAEHLAAPADMILVVVGDKETILPSLEEMDYTIVELDADGNPIE